MFRQVIYCTIAITAFASISFGQKSSVKLRKASILYCDSSTLNSYKTKLAPYNTKRDSGLINKLFSIIYKFNGKPLDTIITTTGKLDANGSLCKIRTRVYLYGDTVFVDSRLVVNHELLWRYCFKDPVSWFYIEHNLFLLEDRSLWVYFTAGIFDGLPDFVDYKSTELEILDEFPPDGKMVIDNDISDFKKRGFNITEKQLRIYLKNFKGDLFTYGDCFNKERLYIWYSPAKSFMLFYAP